LLYNDFETNAFIVGIFAVAQNGIATLYSYCRSIFFSNKN